MISSIGQAIGYLGAIALNPVSAGVAIATNASAGATTLGKILSDLQNNRVLNISDLASVAGNIMVIGAAVALSLNPASTAAKVTTAIANGIGWLGASKMMIDKALPHFSLVVSKDEQTNSETLGLAG